MRNIKLVLEYDGSSFFGFQRQPHHPSIQQVIEEALSRLLNQKTKIHAASGRTDTGVHAKGQAVNFKTARPLSVTQIQKGLNGILPKEIAVKEAAEVPSDFHARYSARSKIYEYRIWNHPVRSPLRRMFSVHVSHKLNLRKMRQAALLLTGQHDFRSFCASDPSRKEKTREKPTVRTIFDFCIKKESSLIRILIEADGFLYHMVRNIVGALLEIGSGRLSLEEFKCLVKARDRTKAPSRAPAHGLFLIAVKYL